MGDRHCRRERLKSFSGLFYMKLKLQIYHHLMSSTMIYSVLFAALLCIYSLIEMKNCIDFYALFRGNGYGMGGLDEEKKTSIYSLKKLFSRFFFIHVEMEL